MTLRFGTDGVRGVANVELTPELALALGRVAARVLPRGRFVVGRDTRVSGPLLEAALVAGLAAEGARVDTAGVIPTPAIARLASADGGCGAVVSASHNPFPDNGIKLFAPGGRKLDEETEGRLEAELGRLLEGGRPGTAPAGADVGTVRDVASDARRRYCDALVATLGGRRLDGLRVVVDCANGAASTVGPAALEAAGAEVEVRAADPDGTNINAGCGSTEPAALQAAVVSAGADAGLAFDGDADRVVAVDHTGALVDGDRTLAVLALDRRAAGRLPGGTVVVTVMTNEGFRRAMRDAGIAVVDTPVGDRHVAEALERGGFALGGEQSGHVILHDLAPTGDGILTGLHLLDAVRRSGRTLAELAACMTPMPQVLRNVDVARRPPDVAEALADRLAAAERRLGDGGRVLLRPSGTEPVVRVMVEADDADLAARVAEELAGAVSEVCAAAP